MEGIFATHTHTLVNVHIFSLLHFNGFVFLYYCSMSTKIKAQNCFTDDTINYSKTHGGYTWYTSTSAATPSGFSHQVLINLLASGTHFVHCSFLWILLCTDGFTSAQLPKSVRRPNVPLPFPYLYLFGNIYLFWC